MRRSALLGMALLASGCTGAGDFVSNTFSPYANPNRPLGDSETLRRVNGQSVEPGALLPEAGNVWPGPVKLQPSLQDIMKQGSPISPGGLPPPNVPAEPYRGSPPGVAPELNFPGLPRPNIPATAPKGAKAPPPGSAAQPITIDNGNGTSTIIKPDGTIETVPNKP